MVDGTTQRKEMEHRNQSVIDVDLHKIVLTKKGVPFKEIEILIGTIRHEATAVPTGILLMKPINKILQVKTRIVWWKDFRVANQAFRDWRTLLKEPAYK